jgi:hypothetical protein
MLRPLIYDYELIDPAPPECCCCGRDYKYVIDKSLEEIDKPYCFYWISTCDCHLQNEHSEYCSLFSDPTDEF